MPSARLALALLLAVVGLAPVGAASDRPFDPAVHSAERLAVTVRADAAIPARVAALPGSRLRPEHAVAPEQLEAWHSIAERRLGRALPDPNRHLVCELPAGADPVAALELLRAQDWVAAALPLPLPARAPSGPAPLPPDFFALQGYPNPAPSGLGVVGAWTVPGATGTGVRLCDLEYSFNASHVDLPSVQIAGPAPNDPFDDPNHGTAVLGVIGAQPNAFGTIGIAPAAELWFAAANTGPGSGTYSVGAAITNAMTVLGPGDVLVIEQQMFGPDPALGSGCSPGDPLSNGPGLVPIEWQPSWYDAVVLAVGNGIVVVEAAGNGQVDLDDPAFAVGHAPFLPQNDSGAIIVGAGHAPGSTDVARSRHCFSNHGSTVDVQGWGAGVVTTGFGGLWSSGGDDEFYTQTFSGTSSATAQIGALCACIQGAALATTGAPLDPHEVLEVLRRGALPQTAGTFGTDDVIGPLPDLTAALVPDADGNGVPDAIDIARGAVADCNDNGVPDAAEIGPFDDLDGDGVLDSCEPPPLSAASFSVSLSGGGDQQLTLDAGAPRAGQLFVMLGSATGSAPGTVDPVTGIAVPLVLDTYFLDLLVLQGGGVITPFVGWLDANGRASASFAIPPATAPHLAGVTLFHAFVSIDLAGSGLLDFASNAVPLELAP